MDDTLHVDDIRQKLRWRALPNPFPNVTAASDITPGYLSGRKTDIVEIISNTPSAIILAGAPGIGKSTLIRYLQIPPDAQWSWRDELQDIRTDMELDKLHFVQIDLKPLQGIESLEQIYAQFIKQCYYAVYKEHYNLETTEDANLESLRDLLRGIQREAGNVRYMVLLDNVERLGRQGPVQEDLKRTINLLDHSKVIGTLVDLMDEFSKFGAILSIQSLPRTKFVDQFEYVSADLARFAGMTLQIFTLQEAQDFIKQGLKSDLTKKFKDFSQSSIFSDSERAWLLEQAGTHPYLLQQLCFHTFQLKQKSASVRGTWTELVESDKRQLLEWLTDRLSPFLANMWQRIEEALNKSSRVTKESFADFVHLLVDKRVDNVLDGKDWERFGPELRYILYSEGIVRFDLYQDINYPGAIVRDYLMQKTNRSPLMIGRGPYTLDINLPGKAPDSFSPSEIEYHMLKKLLQNPENCTEEDLMKAAWGKKTERPIFTQRMHHLRKKLKEHCGGLEIIENRYGGRYSLNHPEWFRVSP